MVRFIVWSKSNVMHCELEAVRRMLALHQSKVVQLASILHERHFKPALMIEDPNHEINAATLYANATRIQCHLAMLDNREWRCIASSGISTPKPLLHTHHPYGGNDTVLHYMDDNGYVTILNVNLEDTE